MDFKNLWLLKGDMVYKQKLWFAKEFWPPSFNFKQLQLHNLKNLQGKNLLTVSNVQGPKSKFFYFFHNKLMFNLGFISWFASIFRIHFQSSIFPSFYGFEFKVSLFF